MADLNLNVLEDFDNRQLYESEMALRITMDTIGIGQRERNRVISDGFNSMSDIITLHADDVKGFTNYLQTLNKTFASSSTAALRVYFSPVTIVRFAGVVHYFNQAVNSFHKIPDLLAIDVAHASTLSRDYHDFVKDKNEDETTVEIPKLTGSTNWVDFRDKFIMKCSQTTGCRGITLDYVVDSTPRAVTRANQQLEYVDTIDISDDVQFRTMTTHFGRAFKEDNKAVWDLLKSNLIGEPAYNHISNFNNSNNGRGAWKALVGFYEGEDFKERLRESAFARLSTTFYKGESNRFNFEKYVQVHKEAHKMLEDCGYNDGRGMDDATKIQHFKTGIKQDAGLETALSQIRANPNYRHFDQLISFLTAEVEHKANRTKQLGTSRDRRVSAVTGRGGSRGGGRGRGRGRGRDRRGQAQRSNPEELSREVDGKLVFSRRYSNQEFRSLTRSQREAVIELNRQKRRANNGENNTNISGLTLSDFRDEMISLGDAIVAGVQQASGEEASNLDPNTTADSSATGKRKPQASSGSVGDFIRQRRQRK